MGTKKKSRPKADSSGSSSPDDDRPVGRVGVDLGGTNILAVAIAPDGRRVARHKAATPSEGGASAVLDAVAHAAELVGSELDDPPAAIGVGVPGPVDPEDGKVLRAVNLAGFKKPVAARAELEARLGCRVEVDNDVNVATLGEQRFGAAQGRNDVLGLFAGTGVGGGLVLDGQLRRGPRGLAGEIGHVVVDLFAEEGPRTVEQLAGRAALTRAVRGADAGGRLAKAAKKGAVKSKAWSKAFDKQDPVAVELIDRAAHALAAAVIAATLIVDIEMVVLGGGMGERLGDHLRPRIAELAADWTFVNTELSIVAPALGDESGARGAAMLDLSS